MQKKLLRIKQFFYKHKQILIYYGTVLLGLIMISLFIYARFLRHRLPREIPFKLSFYGWFVLVLICCSYLYVIIRLLYPKQTLSFFVRIISYISKPFITLDLAIKKSKYSYLYYIRIKKNITASILLADTIYRIMLIYLLIIFPGVISLLIFIYDVFIINRIEIYYYFIFLNIFPMFYAYYNYSLMIIKEEYLSELLSTYDEVHMYDKSSEFKPFGEENPEAIYHDKIVPLKEYFHIQLQERYKEPENYMVEYHGIPSAREDIFEQYHIDHNKIGQNLNRDDYDKIDANFYIIEPKLLALMEYIELNPYSFKLYYIKEIRIIIYSLHAITWIYILIKSLHTLPANTFFFLIPQYDNPFE